MKGILNSIHPASGKELKTSDASADPPGEVPSIWKKNLKKDKGRARQTNNVAPSPRRPDKTDGSERAPEDKSKR